MEFRYAFRANEDYFSSSPFNEVVKTAQLAIDTQEYDGEYSLDDILVVNLESGVFIRAKSSSWCKFFTGISETSLEEFPSISIINSGEFDSATRKVKRSLGSFGNEHLAHWRVGF